MQTGMEDVVKVEIPVKLIDVISRDIGAPSRRGNRPTWKCVFHTEKTPSLTLWPDPEHFKCFGCQKHGDAIDWVRERNGLSFKEAVLFLNGTIIGGQSDSDVSRVAEKPLPKKPRAPETDWSRRAGLVVTECAQAIESRAAEDTRKWLRDRGLKRSTLEYWKIGHNAKEQYLHGLKVHEGITIPWFANDQVISVKIRQFRRDSKYVSIAGSRPSGVFLHQDIRAAIPTILFEGEFDALLAWQEVRDLVNVGTLGSAGIAPDQHALIQLLGSPLILLSYDRDDPGTDAIKRWQETTERCRVARVPHGKDLTDFFMQGGDIKSWASGELSRHT